MADLELEPSQPVNGYHAPAVNGSSPSVDPADVVAYLSSLLTITLGASKRDLESQYGILGEDVQEETVDRCVSFLQSFRTALYAQKRELPHLQNGGDEPCEMPDLVAVSAY